MKIHRLALRVLMPIVFLAGMAATRQDALDSVLGALKSGNATQLAGRFEKELTLTLPDQSSSLNKAQAQAAITKFFSNYPVTGFELKHRGNAPGGAFAIGTLLTEKGQFRVNVFMSPGGPKEGVRELRIQTMD
ncbi:MAG: DUF4783 domain-containing protein [Sphingomonadales bacterium]